MGGFTLDIGARPTADGVFYRVRSPVSTSVYEELVDADARKVPLQREGEYFQGLVPAAPGDRYWYSPL